MPGDEPGTALGSERWANPQTSTEVKKGSLLGAYIDHGTIRAAAKVAQVNEWSHYAWMREDPDYAEAFGEAKLLALDRLKQEAIRRAVDGVDHPVTWQGEITDTYREYSDTLLIFLMKAGAPEVYRDNFTVEHTGKDGGPLTIAVAPLPAGALSERVEIVDGRVIHVEGEVR